MPLVLLFLLAAALPGAELPQWRETTITDSLKMGYQLVAADLNRDGRPDLIVVDERGTELAWFENPTWERHVIIKDVPRTINLDVYDYDGDGIPEIAMGHNFETVPEKSIGNVLILKSGPDPRQPWTAREIDRIPTVHRLRWIDLAGDGKKVLLVAPMIGPKAHPPDYADNVPVYLYRPGEWKRELFTDQPRGILHSITAGPLAGTRRATHDGRLSRHPRISGTGAGGDRQGRPTRVPAMRNAARSRSAIWASAGSSPLSSRGTATKSWSTPKTGERGSAM